MCCYGSVPTLCQVNQSDVSHADTKLHLVHINEMQKGCAKMAVFDTHENRLQQKKCRTLFFLMYCVKILWEIIPVSLCPCACRDATFSRLKMANNCWLTGLQATGSMYLL